MGEHINKPIVNKYQVEEDHWTMLVQGVQSARAEIRKDKEVPGCKQQWITFVRLGWFSHDPRAVLRESGSTCALG